MIYLIEMVQLKWYDGNGIIECALICYMFGDIVRKKSQDFLEKKSAKFSPLNKYEYDVQFAPNSRIFALLMRIYVSIIRIYILSDVELPNIICLLFYPSCFMPPTI
jgi:hypothetical protein